MWAVVTLNCLAIFLTTLDHSLILYIFLRRELPPDKENFAFRIHNLKVFTFF